MLGYDFSLKVKSYLVIIKQDIMKNALKTQLASLIAVLFISISGIMAQDVTTVKASNQEISNHLDLEAVASIFGDSKDLADFEKRLNDPEAKISNLDLNNDNYVDYLRVVEVTEKHTHLIAIQAVLDDDVFQDVATIEVEKDNEGVTRVQIVGDVYMYGEDYIIEPVYVHRPVIFVNFWRPYYNPYCSTYYWGYYPHYYHHWHPFHIDVYHTHIHHYVNVQHTYHYTNVRRSRRAIGLHRTHRRNDYGRRHPERSYVSRRGSKTNLSRRSSTGSRRGIKSRRSSTEKVSSRALRRGNRKGSKVAHVGKERNLRGKNTRRGTIRRGRKVNAAASKIGGNRSSSLKNKPLEYRNIKRDKSRKSNRAIRSDRSSRIGKSHKSTEVRHKANRTLKASKRNKKLNHRAAAKKRNTYTAPRQHKAKQSRNNTHTKSQPRNHKTSSHRSNPRASRKSHTSKTSKNTSSRSSRSQRGRGRSSRSRR